MRQNLYIELVWCPWPVFPRFEKFGGTSNWKWQWLGLQVRNYD